MVWGILDIWVLAPVGQGFASYSVAKLGARVDGKDGL